MSFRFRRSVPLLPGIKLNIGKKGASVSVGPRGAKVTVGTKEATGTLGLPGSGLFLSKHHSWTGKSLHSREAPESVRAVISQRDRYWEFEMLLAALDEEVDKFVAIWENSTVASMDIPVYCRWARNHINELTALLDLLTQIGEKDSVEAIGAPGVSGDPDKIIGVVPKLAVLVQLAADWEQEVKVYAEHPIFGEAASQLSGASRPLLDAILEYRKQLDEQLAVIETTHAIQIELKVKLLPQTSDYTSALESLNATFEKEGFDSDLFQTDF